MDNNWKTKFKKELKEYLENLQTFKNKWQTERVADLKKQLDKKYDKISKERSDLYKKAISFLEEKIKTSKNKIQIGILKEKIGDLNKEYVAMGSRNILNYTTKKEDESIREILEDFDKVCIDNASKQMAFEYPNLMMFLYLLRICNVYSIKLNDSYSNRCKNCFQYYNFICDIDDSKCKKEDLFEYPYIEFTRGEDIVDIDKYGIIKHEDVVPYAMLSESFVNILLGYLDGEEFTSIPDFVEYMWKKLNIKVKDIEWWREFKRLFEETPAEILVTDQKDFETMKIEVQKRHNEEMERQAELDREEREEQFYRQQRAEERRQEANAREQRQNAIMQANAVFDSQIAVLKKEKESLYSYSKGTDYVKINTIDRQIRELESKKRNM